MNTQVAKMATLVLAGVCGLFALVAGAQFFGFGSGYSWLADSTDAAPPPPVTGVINRETFKLPGEDKFTEVQNRPPFNEDRKPTPIFEPDKPPPAPAAPLNVALNGVILTPEVHLVMLTDKGKNQAVMIKEGMPLPGDQGGWTLVTIKPRSAVFNDGNIDVEVELTSAATPPPSKTLPGKPGTTADPKPATAATPVPPGTTAPPRSHAATEKADHGQPDDLQRRIEERRRQMREDAAKQAEQADKAKQTKQN